MKAEQCRICGEGLAAAATGGMCPRCLFGTAIAEIVGAPDGAAPSWEKMGDVLKDYEFFGEIGRGGMGAVYEAIKRSNGRRVAVKVLSAAAAGNPEFVERFRREAEVLSGLKHPRIVEIDSWGEQAGILYLVMEFVPGGDLSALLRSRGKLSLEEAVQKIGQACEALEFTHGRGVLHRDIKPGNLLLDDAGGVKLGDFGLAKLIDDRESMGLTMTHASMGTPRYMAPEQMGGNDEVDARTDVYALGVVFYEMLTGGVPGGSFALPSERIGASEKVDEVVLRAMSDTKEGRYASVAEFHRAVRNLVGESSRRGLLVAMGLVVVAGLTWAMIGKSPDRVEVGHTWKFEALNGESLPAGFPSLLEGVKDVQLSDARGEFGVALMADGTLRGFGADGYGQARPPAGRTFIAVAVGQGERAAHGIALSRDGSVVAWGDDSFGQTQVPEGLKAAQKIAAGEFWSAAQLHDGSVVRWGRSADQNDEPTFGGQKDHVKKGRTVVVRRLE